MRAHRTSLSRLPPFFKCFYNVCSKASQLLSQGCFQGCSTAVPVRSQCVSNVFLYCFPKSFQCYSRVVPEGGQRRLQGFPAAVRRRCKGCFSVSIGASKALTGLAQGFHMACAVCSNEFSSFTKVVPRLSQCIFTL